MGNALGEAEELASEEKQGVLLVPAALSILMMTTDSLRSPKLVKN
jgi:hypothetical protein